MLSWQFTITMHVATGIRDLVLASSFDCPRRLTFFFFPQAAENKRLAIEQEKQKFLERQGKLDAEIEALLVADE